MCKLWADPVHPSWKRELITPLDRAHRAEEAGLTALVGGAIGTASAWAELTEGGAIVLRISELAGGEACSFDGRGLWRAPEGARDGSQWAWLVAPRHPAGRRRSG